MKKIIQIGADRFLNGKKTTKAGALTFAISALVALIADKYHVTFITENPEYYWGVIVPSCLSLIFGGKK